MENPYLPKHYRFVATHRRGKDICFGFRFQDINGGWLRDKESGTLYDIEDFFIDLLELDTQPEGAK